MHVVLRRDEPLPDDLADRLRAQGAVIQWSVLARCRVLGDLWSKRGFSRKTWKAVLLAMYPDATSFDRSELWAAYRDGFKSCPVCGKIAGHDPKLAICYACRKRGRTSVEPAEEP